MYVRIVTTYTVLRYARWTVGKIDRAGRVLMAVRCQPAQEDEQQWYSELKLSSFEPLE